MERTLSIIKPDAVKKQVIGEIFKAFEENNLKIVATKMIHMDRKVAEGFYYVHKGKGFFEELIEFMTSGPVVVSVLEGKNAVKAHRELMGATNPKDAKEGTLRKRFASSLGQNAVHGSDSLENAKYEINHFFNAMELH